MCFLRTCLIGIMALMTAMPIVAATAETGTPLQPPPYRLNRADEDYRYLADPALRTDLWDPLK
jgi:hypothetical protein